MQIPDPSGLVTLLTDFGLQDPYVGIMKGMLKRQDRRAEVIDLCHAVPPQDVAVGAFFLAAARGRFPAGTVHVAVVDPGVGTARRVLAVCAYDCYWIAPDNGLLARVLAPVLAGEADGEVRAVDVAALRLVPESATFHGRDVFAPLAGMLSGRRYGFRAVGPRVTDPVDEAPRVSGDHVLLVDGFGNLITTLDAAAARGATGVEIAGRTVPLVRTYADADPGALLALVDSYGLVEIAVCRGRADTLLGIGRGAPVRVQR